MVRPRAAKDASQSDRIKIKNLKAKKIPKPNISPACSACLE